VNLHSRISNPKAAIRIDSNLYTSIFVHDKNIESKLSIFKIIDICNGRLSISGDVKTDSC
jgi:hypothetical protein